MEKPHHLAVARFVERVVVDPPAQEFHRTGEVAFALAVRRLAQERGPPQPAQFLAFCGEPGVEALGPLQVEFVEQRTSELYRGGKGSLWASMALAIIATGSGQTKEVSGPCTAGDSIALQIPE